jgi:threonine/homoserine efflux transporter RhtA
MYFTNRQIHCKIGASDSFTLSPVRLGFMLILIMIFRPRDAYLTRNGNWYVTLSAMSISSLTTLFYLLILKAMQQCR